MLMFDAVEALRDAILLRPHATALALIVGLAVPIAIFLLQQRRANSSSPQCAICLTTLTEPSERGPSLCTHRFHASCLDKWLARYPDTKKQLDKESLAPRGAVGERVAPRIRHGESGAAIRNGKLASGTADVAPAAPKKPSLLKRLSTRSALKAADDSADDGAAKGASVRDVASLTAAGLKVDEPGATGMSAAEQMAALNARKGEMSAEEYAREREAIIQSI